MTLEITRTCNAAPVQYEGTIEGKYLYFRARGDEWSFVVADTLEEAIDGFSQGEIFVKTDHYGDNPNPEYGAYAASFMPMRKQNA